MSKWYTPVGLYDDQMQALDRLLSKLVSLGIDTEETRSLRDVINYFKSETNDAYLTMKELDKRSK